MIVFLVLGEVFLGKYGVDGDGEGDSCSGDGLRRGREEMVVVVGDEGYEVMRGFDKFVDLVWGGVMVKGVDGVVVEVVEGRGKEVFV